MSIEDKLRQVTAHRRVVEEESGSQRLGEASRKRLLKILQKKLTTSFIGALAKFEGYIGTELWGHGKPEEECTKDQLAWREIWEQCRTEVLNNGNSQLRAVESEIVQYSISWNRYHTNLKIGGRNDY